MSVLERISTATTLDIQYGGGIKTSESLRSVLEAGASRVICGIIAVLNPDSFEEWLSVYGPEHVILGADTKNGKIAINGWLDSSTIGVSDIIRKFAPRGLSQVICTDISKDGMLSGTSFDLYNRLQSEFPDIEITASGGISSMSDIKTLDSNGIRSVIVGKAIYEGAITFEELRLCLQNE